mgnify:CR=1 FL=1
MPPTLELAYKAWRKDYTALDGAKLSAELLVEQIVLMIRKRPRAILENLCSRPDLNERTVKVVSFPSTTEPTARCGVQLDGSDEPPFAVKLLNLRPVESSEEVEELAAELLAASLTEQAGQPAKDPTQIPLVVGGLRFVTTARALCAVRGSFFEVLLRQHEMGTMRTTEDGTLSIDRPGTHFQHVLDFLSSWPQPRVSPDLLSDEAIEELLVEADFYMLPPLSSLLAARRANRVLKSADLHRREAEDALRHLFASERGNAALLDPHVGLVQLFNGPGGRTRPQLKCRRPEASYRVLLDGLQNRFGSQSPPNGPIVDTSDAFTANFEESYGGLLRGLRSVACTPECSWFIAGGAVLRALLLTGDPVQRLFSGSDLDIFICARHEDAAAREAAATEMARQICEAIGPPPRTSSSPRGFGGFGGYYGGGELIRTLFTINFNGSVHGEEDHPGNRRQSGAGVPCQIILRCYHSPAEVLLGFDIDCCCVGYDGADVWVLPRALASLETGTVLLNPLHAWPRQPSYELRLSKYAARGFHVASPGVDQRDWRWRECAQRRLIELRGAARLIKIELTLAARHHPSPLGYLARGEGEHDPQKHPIFQEPAFTVLGQPVLAPPTDEDVARTIVEDPYGWIHNNMVADLPGTSPSHMPHYWRRGSNRDDAAALKAVMGTWAQIADAGRDDLHIPRRIKWAVLPRSREYMNMQIPFDVLSERYLAAASDASLATATVDEEEYSEKFMVRYRNRGQAPAEEEGGNLSG